MPMFRMNYFTLIYSYKGGKLGQTTDMSIPFNTKYSIPNFTYSKR